MNPDDILNDVRYEFVEQLGNSIKEDKNINLIVPIRFESFIINDNDVSGWENDVWGFEINSKKAMWPIFKETNGFMRGDKVISNRKVAYQKDRVYLLCNDYRGIWLFIRHEYKNMIGFITSFSNVYIKDYGNTPSKSIQSWLSTDAGNI